MKKIDPTIELVGPEINQFSYDPSPGATTNFGQRDEDWLIEFLKANGDLVDVVSFHRYPFPSTGHLVPSPLRSCAKMLRSGIRSLAMGADCQGRLWRLGARWVVRYVSGVLCLSAL
jgi:hypothetical protein